MQHASEKELRIAAIRTGKADGGAFAHDALTGLLSHEDSATRGKVAEALFAIGGAGDWVDSIVSDPDADVRLCILRQLATARDPRLIQIKPACPHARYPCGQDIINGE